ncbi:probable helicase MAGATAMA 3 [Tanacetum coccineum]
MSLFKRFQKAGFPCLRRNTGCILRANEDTSKDKGTGFVGDFRRMNVGITRATASVLVFGYTSGPAALPNECDGQVRPMCRAV